MFVFDKKILFSCFVVSFYTVISFSIFFISKKDLYFPISSKVKMYQSLIIPEGFSFFTKNPDEDSFYLFKMDSDEKLIEIFLKPKILKSFLGFNRNYRFKRGSFYRLLNKIDGWEECSRQIKDCLKNMELKTFFIKSRKGVFCGKYVFQYKKPIPLAWVGIEHTFIQKSKLLKVKLECL